MSQYTDNEYMHPMEQLAEIIFWMADQRDGRAQHRWYDQDSPLNRAWKRCTGLLYQWPMSRDLGMIGLSPGETMARRMMDFLPVALPFVSINLALAGAMSPICYNGPNITNANEWMVNNRDE